MIKTIKAGKTSIKLSNNLSWAMAYKDQFNHDIIPDLMPILSALLKLIGEFFDGTNDVQDVLKRLDDDKVNEILIELCSLQFVDFLNLVWALNKAADEDIADPKEWVKQFDEFPLDVIAPAVFDLIVKGLVSSKNLKSLREMMPKAESASK